MRPPPQHQLSDRAVAAWRVDGVRTALLQGFAVMGLLLVVVPDFSLALAIGGAEIVLVTIFGVAIAPHFYARTWRYEISDNEVYLQSGFITVTRHTVPLRRIQNVDTVQGPIDRFFGLSSVTVSTAGGRVVIPHLDEPVADALRAQISARSRAARGEQDVG